MCRWAPTLLLVALGAIARPQITPVESAGIHDVLSVGNFRLSDLQFPRIVFPQVARLPLVTRCLSQPLESADELMALHESARSTPLGAVLEVAAGHVLEGRPAGIPGPVVVASPVPPEVPAGLRAPLGALVEAMRRADQEIRLALAPLKPAELRELIEGLPALAVEEPKLEFEFAKSAKVSPARVRELTARIDVARIARAGVALSVAGDAAVLALSRSTVDVPGRVRVTWGGLPVVIAGRGADLHEDRDARLTVDLGGHDMYVGRHGAGVGYASVLLDLGGNDRYEVPDLSIGAAIAGVGLAYDRGGHDTFTGRTLCFGVGLAGVGAFQKWGGHDDYRAVALSQGYGHEGVGVCLDTDGDDRYSVKLLGQGAARTGGVGWLVDRKGDDIYRAGGLVLNSPLFSDVYYSFAQGFGSGYREDTGGWSGGVGLLTDLAGLDAYLAESYAQAASYWYAVGSLYDATGNDSYTGHHYAQSSAMHICGAYLFDLAGQDSYTVKYGASLAIGHDYGVAVMLDRAGDDIFVGRDSAPGTGSANGLGIFIDSGGIDRYDGPPGFASPARGTGSLGVFVDLGGADKYREGLGDGVAGERPLWGMALDVPDPKATGPGPVAARPVPGSVPVKPEGEMAEVYRRATQWGVGTSADEVRTNVDLLIGIGMPALDWMLVNRLAGSDRLQQRAFAEVVRALGPDGAAALARTALTGDRDVKRKVVSIAVDSGATDIGALIPAMLEDPELALAAAKAAGALKAGAAVPGLVRLCLSDDPMLSRACAISLSQIGSIESVGTAQALLRSPDPFVREAALDLLAKIPNDGAVVARALCGEADESRARLGVALYARLSDAQAIREVASFLLDPRPGLRIEALLGLDRRCPVEFERTMLSLRDDPVALVRMVANGVRPAP